MMGVSVRVVEVTDRGAVASAAALLHDFNTEFDTPTPGVEALADRIARTPTDGLFIVVAADDDADVGLAVVSLRPNVWFDGPVALVDELYVRPEHRNAGIGTCLMGEVRAEASRRGVEHLEIAVDEPDLDARRFYERHGFSPLDLDSGDRVLLYSGPVARA